ncbi:hypothetical protein RRG08_054303 [Elysia crispata]|uniref:Uncharacterized protein n=1 Tax=Elysia crispata TaxID=231223 RepID=A0AAE1D8V7_9GAST|nr:hypothetical protein RRG08_054303 [Elysia crispata]
MSAPDIEGSFRALLDTPRMEATLTAALCNGLPSLCQHGSDMTAASDANCRHGSDMTAAHNGLPNTVSTWKRS